MESGRRMPPEPRTAYNRVPQPKPPATKFVWRTHQALLTSLVTDRVQHGLRLELQGGLRSFREKSPPLKRRATNAPSLARRIMEGCQQSQLITDLNASAGLRSMSFRYCRLCVQVAIRTRYTGRFHDNFRVRDDTPGIVPGANGTSMCSHACRWRVVSPAPRNCGQGVPRPLPRTPFPDRDRLVSGMPRMQIVRSTHTMTLPILDRAFDVIFVVAGDNKASVVHELFNAHNRRFKYPVERVQPKSRNVL
jgi:hypothetical protein